jgi:hypothetical protein
LSSSTSPFLPTYFPFGLAIGSLKAKNGRARLTKPFL